MFMTGRLLAKTNAEHRVGLFSIELEAYWLQFRGFRDRLVGYNSIVAQKMTALGAEVVNLGMVDTPEAAIAAGHAFRQTDIDLLLFTYQLTRYPPPSCQLSAEQKLRSSY